MTSRSRSQHHGEPGFLFHPQTLFGPKQSVSVGINKNEAWGGGQKGVPMLGSLKVGRCQLLGWHVPSGKRGGWSPPRELRTCLVPGAGLPPSILPGPTAVRSDILTKQRPSSMVTSSCRLFPWPNRSFGTPQSPDATGPSEDSRKKEEEKKTLRSCAQTSVEPSLSAWYSWPILESLD